MHVWLWNYWHRSLISNNHKKKFNGVKSHDLGSQFWSPKRESTRPGNISCSNWIVSLAVCHVVFVYVIVLLKSHIGHINIVQFRQKELCYHVAISSIINSCYVILKKVWSFLPKIRTKQWYVVGAFVFR